MSIRKYLETAPLFTIIKSPQKNDYSKTGVAFTGSPRKHPYDEGKLLLIRSPLSSETEFYEFRLSDIIGAEEMPSLANEAGESVIIVKIWVKKGAFGMKYIPFEVQEPIQIMNDSDLLHQVLSEETAQ